MNEIPVHDPAPVPQPKNDSIQRSFPSEHCQVVHGIFFSHSSNPSLTLRPSKLYVNTACLKMLPDTDYIQLLIHQTEKKLAVRPCREDTKDPVRWCSNTSKRSPRRISCPVFFAKIVSLMEWNPAYRYRLTGRLLSAQEERLIVFDLTEPEVFPISAGDPPGSSSSAPIYPKEWKHQFGIPLPEHQNSPQIRIFDQYAVFLPEPLQPQSPKTTTEPTAGPITESTAEPNTAQKGGTVS